MINKLSIFQINVNSLISLQKRHEMNDFLSTHKPDIVLVCETKLKGQKIYFKNYEFIRNDRNFGQRGGGTGILLRNSIKYEIIPSPNLNSIESTTIKISLINNENIFLSSIYVSPTNNELNVADINKLIELTNGCKFIIGGDFNAKHTLWKNRIENKNCKALFNWYMNTHFPVIIKSSLHPSRIVNETS